MLSISVISVVLLRLQIHQEGVSKNVSAGDSAAENAIWFEYDSNAAQKSELPTQISKLDFLQIEKILWRSKLDEFNRLKVNSTTLEHLEQIHALLPKPITTKESERLFYLVKKSIPVAGGEELAELISRYNLYAQHSLNVATSLSYADEKQRVSHIMQRAQKRADQQVDSFGPDLATKLFNKKNITNVYLDQRMLVNLDKSISDDKRRQLLADLLDKYRLSISEEP